MNKLNPGPGGLHEVFTLRDDLGTIGVIEGEQLLSFPVKRVYFIYSVAQGAERGAHAHKQLRQLIFAAQGSFTVTLDDGSQIQDYILDSPTKALMVEPGNWRTLKGFSHDAVVMVLASLEYDEADYIRDYQEFLEWRGR